MVLKSGCFHPIPSASETVKPQQRQLGHPSHDTKEFSSQINLLMVQRSKMTLSSKGEGFHGNGGKTAASLPH